MATKKQLVKWRKEAKIREKRSKYLSKRYGYNVTLIDLNPHVTAGRKYPKSALTKSGRKTQKLGTANTRKKTIDVDYRVPKSMQHKVIKHEIEHIKNPRATESQVRRRTGGVTFRKKRKKPKTYNLLRFDL